MDTTLDQDVRDLLPQDWQEREREFDELLKTAVSENASKRGPVYSLPQMLGEYEAVPDKPGLYLRPMCLETELRAIELYEIVGDGSIAGQMRVGIGIAAASLFRLNLPNDATEAREKILAYARGEVSEDEIFQQLTEIEVGRLIKSTDELKKLVLDPLEINFSGEAKADGDASPN